MDRRLLLFLTLAVVIVGMAGFGSSATVLAIAGQSSDVRSSKTVWDGVYTAEQATRGQTVFTNVCATCHRSDLTGNGSTTPALAGAKFVDRWREDTLAPLFDHMRTRMPRTAPGTLQENNYLDLLAFVLQTNTFPPGSSELTPDAVGNIQFVGKDGPQPLPNRSPVLMVGCLTQGPDSTWTVTRASAPVRTRRTQDSLTDELKAAELKASETKPLGAQTISLQNLTIARSAAQVNGWVGNKVQVKGILVRQPTSEYVNVVALDSVSSSCGG
jgi:S-disulfanyl-L-cysteine oxidoreductase SoxD